MLYPVYALLFADAGLSTAEISSLFAVWSITSFTLEIPSGVWSDGRSRRLLLTIAPLLAGTGFALWVVAPSYPFFLAGFVLWGAQGALQSGALAALVYEELEHAGAADRYAQVIGRATALGTIAATVAIGVAAPVFAAGGFVAVGAASVAACVAAAAVASGFPEHRVPSDGDVATGFRRYRAVLAEGIAEARSAPAVRAALLLVPAVTAVWGALDEYVPLLAAGTGVTDESVPLLFLLVYLGVAFGGLLSAAASRLSMRSLGALLALAAVALAAGSLSGVPLGFVLVAAGFCVFQAVTVVADARLQEAITGRSRATVTSLAGFATEVLVVAVFGAYAVGSAFAGHAVLFAAFAAFYFAVAAAMIASSGDG